MLRIVGLFCDGYLAIVTQDLCVDVDHVYLGKWIYEAKLGELEIFRFIAVFPFEHVAYEA